MFYNGASRSGKDKTLHDLVSEGILPQLVESAAARRRAEEKQAAIEAMPKKRSSRLQVPCPICLHCILFNSPMQSMSLMYNILMLCGSSVHRSFWYAWHVVYVLWGASHCYDIYKLMLILVS